MSERSEAGMNAAICAWSIHVPGLPVDAALRTWAPEEACPPERAHELLGRKGLSYKEPATRLALCAVHRALGARPGDGRRPGEAIDCRTAVVASSNLGNVDTVSAVARAVHDRALREVSPLDAPNVSSNVVASTVALWFRFGGPNLMVCSGHPSGLDAVWLARLLLAAGRADRVVVVGTEPDDATATLLLRRDPGTPEDAPLRAGAACAVLVHASAAPVGAPVVGDVAFAAQRPGDGDLTVDIGATYGALGVLQVAIAAAMVSRPGGPDRVRVVCGDDGDGWRTTTVTRGRQP